MENRFPNTTKYSVIFLLTLVTIPVLILTFANHNAKHMVVVKEARASAPATPTPTAQNIVRVETSGALAQQESIDNYIKTIFGSEARTAIAINRHECNPANKTYPHCLAISDVEYSVGVFQINLKSKYTKVHYDRIPGDTLEEKVAWLQVPQNNILFAFWLYQTSGFWPWTCYKTGAYKDAL